MRIHDVITRLWGDIAAQPVAVALLTATVVTLALLVAVGLVVLARRATHQVKTIRARHQWRRSTREGTPQSHRALTTEADHHTSHDTTPRPTCTPRQPTAHEIYQTTTTATQICRNAANHKDPR